MFNLLLNSQKSLSSFTIKTQVSFNDIYFFRFQLNQKKESHNSKLFEGETGENNITFFK